ncbi:type I-E CRISPR-associated protein Cas6/Cse3/CasE [Verminephrobacter aporrectodeae subsp. tuberculatae]|uniref:type I-E CRISPR-associated protein Cas6/Cse3/CasE n=1 Tax=Verminephrobacter aporrectodeae TaxID=1110389 RepID=UPI002243611C|nr:type I-E CRISPR-associated protein Cas6/Cse3/CasE [Verminephrobacter aporrectodeae]MCW8165009.1 type I-E CRISPR-associated protein Cas6/Cse3/CasE [Verminephrobacter aporrectodeae subsp. tuberculatae]MCW8168348.1 type I-E CRISPR-associated protein Cas6/Cse3/CasE [Verminephrobacter aporrectodeae subsp. tuberculatae]
MSTPSLHLLHTRPDARLLAAWVARHHARHERQASDLGDALHGLLRAAFGQAAPQPFRYLDEHQGLLAYTPLDADAMRAQVALADPLAAQTLGLGANDQHAGYRLRPFPTHWPAGQVLGFEVRLRPTVRAAKGERDAFLHAVEQAQGAPLNRQTVYVQWLREHLAPREGAAREPWQGAVELLDDVHLAGYQRQKIVRRTQAMSAQAARHGHVSDGPDALLKGHLRVLDPAAFAQLLARGVARHRAFGFGMLLLSRAT